MVLGFVKPLPGGLANVPGFTLPADAEGAVVRRGGRLILTAGFEAEGVLTVINSNMANAIRSRTVQKGIDPRVFALVAFGGAGPLHAVEVAAMLGFPEVIVPPYPGITSAMGLLTTDLKYDIIRTEFQVSGSVDLDRLNADMAAMEQQLRKQFAADHLPSASISFMRDGDLRTGIGVERSPPLQREAKLQNEARPHRGRPEPRCRHISAVPQMTGGPQ